MANEQPVTQKQKIKEAFDRIKEDVTGDDKNACAKQLNVSRMTVHNYLTGSFKNYDLAIKILNIFRGKIAEREKQLSAA